MYSTLVKIEINIGIIQYIQFVIYYGDVLYTLERLHETNEPDKTSSVSVAVGVGIGVSLLLIIGVVAAVIVLLYRR